MAIISMAINENRYFFFIFLFFGLLDIITLFMIL